MQYLTLGDALQLISCFKIPFKNRYIPRINPSGVITILGTPSHRQGTKWCRSRDTGPSGGLYAIGAPQKKTIDTYMGMGQN